MELISYYGYRYDGHDDIKYYIATQDLIWRMYAGAEIRWTKGGEYGEEIDISKEKRMYMKYFEDYKDVEFTVYGKKEELASLDGLVKIVDCPDVMGMEDGALQIMRKKEIISIGDMKLDV